MLRYTFAFIILYFSLILFVYFLHIVKIN